MTGWGRLADEALRNLLVSKGVPDDKVDERISAAVDKLGVSAATEALRAKNPWQALKSTATRPGHMFRWILQSELEQHVACRASQAHGTTVPKAKAKKAKSGARKPTALPLHVDPQHLQLVAGSSVTTSGGPLCQLAFHDVTPPPYCLQGSECGGTGVDQITTSTVPESSAAGTPTADIKYPALYLPARKGNHPDWVPFSAR